MRSRFVSTLRSSLVISLTVGAVAAAAVLALLECDFGRAHYLVDLLRVERYLSVTFELSGSVTDETDETHEAEFVRSVDAKHARTFYLTSY